MILEIVMHRMGWTDAWYAHCGPFDLGWFREVCLRGRWSVGVWTGPQHDLLCIKRCATNAEAELYLSPGAPTATLACLAALAKARRLGVKATSGRPDWRDDADRDFDDEDENDDG